MKFYSVPINNITTHTHNKQHENKEMSSSFTISIPKELSTSLTHRKLTVSCGGGNGDGATTTTTSPTINLKELLLVSGNEPKDLLGLFGYKEDEVQTLVQLEKIWDVIEGTHAKFPDIFAADSQQLDPTMRLCGALLAKKMRPMESIHKDKKAAFGALLNMQKNWESIKENHKAAEPSCDFCGTAGPVLRCSGCMTVRKEVRYCNRECQTAGWKQHKKDGCGRFASEGAKERVLKACGKQ
jgi:hypothetical protein